MEQSKFYQIKNVTEHEYNLVGCDGSVITRPIRDIDKSASVFTIQDAKDGDVLFMDNGSANCIFIYKSSNNGIINKYASYNNFGFEGEHYLVLNDGYVIPATREQRDLLFQKMKESGYEWDAEKKELEKIEQEQDVNIQINPSEYINDMGGNGCYLKNTVQSSAWSEEDENYLNTTIAYLKDANEFKKTAEKCITWLKSLRPQNTWKPSDEQMKQLSWIAEQNKDNMIGKELISLYQDLKKLREG